jgi:hypothetical protein
VDAILKKYGAQKPVREHRLVTGWREIVGERVAARAWPDGLKDGALYVRVANSAWLHELSFLRDVVAERANQLVGPPTLVREVRFHLGGRRAADAETEDDVVAELSRQAYRRRRPPPRTFPPPSQATLDRIDQETSAILDPDLRETLRILRRRLGM